MGTHEHSLPPPRKKLQAALLAALAVVVLAGAGVVSSSAPAAQSPGETFNPFVANRGFTVVARGNAVLGNGELAGSVAAFGSLASTVHNYPVRHYAAGLRDYVVPLIDGEPVRILATTFTGVGNIDLTNANATPDSPESRAIAKFVDTQGLRAVLAEPGAYTRVVNPASTADYEGNLDAKALPYTQDVIQRRVQADLGSVGAYFDVDAQLTQADQCLSAMYGAQPAVVNNVGLTDTGSELVVTSFDDTRPNVLSYAAIAGRTIKREGAAVGYVPSAQAPLVITVPAGTTRIGRINIEGWSANAGEQQSYARHILLDLSAVTGTVTMDELELGAIWAPRANLSYSSGVTANGQWFANNVTTAGGGAINHHSFLGELPCPRTGDLSLTKIVSGDGAALVGDATFTFDVTIDGQSHAVSLADGESRLFADLPAGTRVSVAERPVTVPEGAVFAGVDYRADGTLIDPVALTIVADTHLAVVATNTFGLEADTLLTLVKDVAPGNPADWTLTATAGDGHPVVTGAGTATGPVTAGVTYALTESGGPAEYVQDGAWRCTYPRDDGTLAAVDASTGAVVVPRATHVTCTVTNVAATLTVLKVVTGESGLGPADWALTATPGAGVDGLGATTVAGATTPTSGNTFPLRPEHQYALTEQPVGTHLSPSLQVAVERYVGPAPHAPDHTTRSHWEPVDPSAITVDRGMHEVYRFVTFVPTPLALPALGGIGTSSLVMTGGAVTAAGLTVGVVLHRRRTRGLT